LHFHNVASLEVEKLYVHHHAGDERDHTPIQDNQQSACQQNIDNNLFGRQLCPFRPGFRKSNGNGLLSAFDSFAIFATL